MSEHRYTFSAFFYVITTHPAMCHAALKQIAHPVTLARERKKNMRICVAEISPRTHKVAIGDRSSTFNRPLFHVTHTHTYILCDVCMCVCVGESSNSHRQIFDSRAERTVAKPIHARRFNGFHARLTRPIRTISFI